MVIVGAENIGEIPEGGFGLWVGEVLRVFKAGGASGLEMRQELVALMLIPGAEYLAMVPSDVRTAALEGLGLSPTLLSVRQFLAKEISLTPLESVIGCKVDKGRVVFSPARSAQYTLKDMFYPSLSSVDVSGCCHMAIGRVQEADKSIVTYQTAFVSRGYSQVVQAVRHVAEDKPQCQYAKAFPPEVRSDVLTLVGGDPKVGTCEAARAVAGDSTRGIYALVTLERTYAAVPASWAGVVPVAVPPVAPDARNSGSVVPYWTNSARRAESMDGAIGTMHVLDSELEVTDVDDLGGNVQHLISGVGTAMRIHGPAAVYVGRMVEYVPANRYMDVRGADLSRTLRYVVAGNGFKLEELPNTGWSVVAASSVAKVSNWPLSWLSFVWSPSWVCVALHSKGRNIVAMWDNIVAFYPGVSTLRLPAYASQAYFSVGRAGQERRDVLLSTGAGVQVCTCGGSSVPLFTDDVVKGASVQLEWGGTAPMIVSVRYTAVWAGPVVDMPSLSFHCYHHSRNFPTVSATSTEVKLAVMCRTWYAGPEMETQCFERVTDVVGGMGIDCRPGPETIGGVAVDDTREWLRENSRARDVDWLNRGVSMSDEVWSAMSSLGSYDM